MSEGLKYIVEVQMPWDDHETSDKVRQQAVELGGRDWFQLNGDLPKWKRLGIQFPDLESALVLARTYNPMFWHGEIKPYASISLEGWSLPRPDDTKGTEP